MPVEDATPKDDGAPDARGDASDAGLRDANVLDVRLETTTDAPADVRLDAPADVRPDVIADARLDAPVDAPRETTTDSPVDGPAEAAADAPADTVDAAADRALDAPADVTLDVPDGDGCVAGPEVCDGLDNNCDGNIDEGPACRDGCVGLARNGAGYMFCYQSIALNYRSWASAQADCVSIGMHLVRVDDAAENTFINESAMALGFTEEIWLGATYFVDADEWRWTDGTAFWSGGPASGSGSSGNPIGNLFSAWDSGEPQNFTGIPNCTVKRFGNSPLWQTLNCVRQFAYMCER